MVRPIDEDSMNLLTLLQERFRIALAGLVDDPAPYAAMVKPTQDARFGDYQANCAMSLGKVLGKKPREIAEEIVKRLPAGRHPRACPRLPGRASSTFASRAIGWPGSCKSWPGTTGSALSRRPIRERGRRIQLAQRGQTDARRPSAQHHHRRQPRPPACGSSATGSSPTIISATGARSSACCLYGYKHFRDEARSPGRSGAGDGAAVRRVRKRIKAAEEAVPGARPPTTSPEELAESQAPSGRLPPGSGEAACGRPGKSPALGDVHALVHGRHRTDLSTARM